MRIRNVIVLVLVFTLGSVAGIAAKQRYDASLFRGKEKTEAAKALLEVAKRQAEGGSWELIGVGRIYYLSGQKAEGEAIFNSIRRPEGGDLIRIGRVYYAAGEWEKAREVFERAIKMEPRDAPWLAEIGAYYNLQGDRARAEELFAKAMSIERDVWMTGDMAGSYLGVRPLR